uniref:UDENN domain-containing protein n=1 Tax=Heligmosomoides polygyrus TaxID=6339 RepID=A0A183GQ91_HELPZ
LESNKSLPPFDAIWNLSKISVDLEGVGVRSLQSEACPQLPSLFRNYWTLDDLSRPHTPFTAAIDSSFLFVITQKGTPLLAGCYAGNPAPQNSAFSLRAMFRIRNKSPPKEIPRPKEKLTKIQKKGEKIRRKRAAKMKRQAAEVLRKTRKRKKTMMKKAVGPPVAITFRSHNSPPTFLRH